MTMSDLSILYLVVGVACAVAAVRRSDGALRDALFSAGITMVIWPLWAPFVLLKAASPASVPREPPAPEPAGPRKRHPAEHRIARALQGALAAAHSTGLEELLSSQDAQQIQAVATRVGDRLAELDYQLACYERDAGSADNRSAELRQRGASEQAVAAAQRSARCLDRLRRLRDRDACALDELAELCEALRAELMLAHYGAAEELAELKTELWARLEGLTAVASA